MPHPNPDPLIQNINSARADEDIPTGEALGFDGDSVRLYQAGDTLAGVSVSAASAGGLVDYKRGGVYTLRVAGQVRRGDEVGIADTTSTPVAKPASGLVIGTALSGVDAGGYIQVEAWRFGEAVGGGGGGAVDSVNGQTGEVDLDASDIPFEAGSTGLVEDVDDGQGGTVTQPVQDVQAAIEASRRFPAQIGFEGAGQGGQPAEIETSGTGHPWQPAELLQSLIKRSDDGSAGEVVDTIADVAATIELARKRGILTGTPGAAIAQAVIRVIGDEYNVGEVLLPSPGGGLSLPPGCVTTLILVLMEDGSVFGFPPGPAVFFTVPSVLPATPLAEATTRYRELSASEYADLPDGPDDATIYRITDASPVEVYLGAIQLA